MKFIEKRTLILLLLISFVTNSFFGQAGVRAVQNGATTELYFNQAVNKSTYDEVIGSPFLYEDFAPARINDIEKTYFIRINIIDNQIEFKGENDVVMALDKNYDYSINLLDGSKKKYVTLAFGEGKNTTINTFFEEIHVGDSFGLYYKALIVYTPVKLAKNSFEQNRPAKFTKKKGSFYFKDFSTETQLLTLVPNREKLFLKLFDQHAGTIKKFMKKEGLSIDKKEDLIQIHEYYFEL